MFDIKKHICYLVVSGSHSYGLNTDESDYDLRGWCVPPREYFLTFSNNFDQYDETFPYKRYPFKNELFNYIYKNSFRTPEEDEKIDSCVYDIRKFFKLASLCNPNVIELLFLGDGEILIANDFARDVISNRNLFLSAKAKFTYAGYAFSQLKRINTHRRWLLHPPKKKPERQEYGLPETSLISADNRAAAEKLVNYQVRWWLLQDAEVLDQTELSLFHNRLCSLIGAILDTKDLTLSLVDQEKLFDTARVTAMEQLGMALNYISILQAEKKYRSALNEWKQYQHWKKTRNPERTKLEEKYSFDVKNASHLVRLLYQGKQILTEGRLTVKHPDRQIFRDVRAGKWTYEDIVNFLEKEDKELTDIYKNKRYVVPHKPDIKALNALCQELVEKDLKL